MAETSVFATASNETGKKTLRSVAKIYENLLSRRKVADMFLDMPGHARASDTLKSMQAGCEPAPAACQGIELTLDRAAGVVSKRQLTERTFLRSPSGSAAGVFDYAR